MNALIRNRTLRVGVGFLALALALGCSGQKPAPASSAAAGANAGSIVANANTGGMTSAAGASGARASGSGGSNGANSVASDAGRTSGAAGASGRGVSDASGTSGERSGAGQSGVGAEAGASSNAGTSATGTAGTAGSAAACERLDPANPPATLELTGNLGTHDPSLIGVDGHYYLFFTGPGIQTKTSSDLKAWQAGPSVFSQNPGWIAQQVSGATDLWAPDISFFGGVYHLYYAASTFGSNHSCIGHATRASLTSGSWADQGAVICSKPGETDDWNALDPQAVIDETGTPWLALGSFWSGLKLVKLDESGKRADDQLHAIAARPNHGDAIEAPYIVRHCGYYYLFASFDQCCKGADSTYKIYVGRATSVLGPYTDKTGTDMLHDGGTLILQGGTRWRGPGHNAVIFTDHGAFNVYHSYDADNNGQSFLRVSELVWDTDDWPVSGGP